ncbi:restriction endonuclease subunit S [Pectobacterium parvum]|uniref:restriction endonuclease subunit S n=1 Tax=Pectobacterium TaxID=122277 RepID=UPI0013FD4788|nr:MULTISPECIES: restriction endonuclease subunit S [Pectobacterium]UVD98885.1 restriction endonuclease subunit S [Pectobacterium parvum]
MAKQISNKIPELRFKKFKNGWVEELILSRITKIIDFRGRTPKKLGLDWNEAGYLALSALNVKDGYIDHSADAHFGNEKLYNIWMQGNELHCNQVLFTTEAPMGNVAQIPDDQKYILSQRTIAFVTDPLRLSEDYLATLIKSPSVFNQLLARASGGTAKGVSQKSLLTLNVILSDDTDEQAKVGGFFKKLNRLIKLYQHKHEKLVTLKKVMLHKMFPQDGATTPEIRFKGFGEKWKVKRLEDIGEFNPKASLPEIFEYIDLESVIGTKMVSHRTVSKSAAPSRAQRLAQEGDLFFQTVRPYQKNNYLFALPYTDYVFSTGYAQIRPLNDGNFLLALMQRDLFVKTVMDNCTGTSYPAINSHVLSKIIVCVPSALEQQKIGAYFRKLDELISQHATQLEKLKQIKSACLAKMFV